MRNVGGLRKKWVETLRMRLITLLHLIYKGLSKMRQFYVNFCLLKPGVSLRKGLRRHAVERLSLTVAAGTAVRRRHEPRTRVERMFTIRMTLFKLSGPDA